MTAGVGADQLLAQMIRNGAKVAQLHPVIQAEQQYRPSIALQWFIRCRDMTCRFPGCDAPAEHCDIDQVYAILPGRPTLPVEPALPVPQAPPVAHILDRRRRPG